MNVSQELIVAPKPIEFLPVPSAARPATASAVSIQDVSQVSNNEGITDAEIASIAKTIIITTRNVRLTSPLSTKMDKNFKPTFVVDVVTTTDDLLRMTLDRLKHKKIHRSLQEELELAIKIITQSYTQLNERAPYLVKNEHEVREYVTAVYAKKNEEQQVLVAKAQPQSELSATTTKCACTIL